MSLRRRGGVAFGILGRVIHRGDTRTGGKSFRSQFGTGCETLHQRLVYLSQDTRIQKLVHGIFFTSLLQELQMIVHVGHGIGGNGTGCRGTGSSNTGETRISASQKTIHGGFEIGEGKGQEFTQQTGLRRRRSGRPGHTIGSTISSQKGFVGQGGTNNGEFQSIPNIGNGTFDGLEQHFDTFLFVFFVFFSSGCKLFPGFVRFSTG
mmetsp:Transcript_25194/g.52395  ORF Transcript_25194/g.52395 Transcript_25194/m.52395 type:complete len:206 (+) Transcript_25194:203-820(+)